MAAFSQVGERSARANFGDLYDALEPLLPQDGGERGVLHLLWQALKAPNK
jgi:hypothetical protein